MSHILWLLFGVSCGGVWAVVGMKAQDFWWNRCVKLSRPTFSYELLAAFLGPITYLGGFIGLGMDSNYDFFGRKVKKLWHK